MSSITTDGPATTGAKLGVAIAENEALRLRDMVRSGFQSYGEVKSSRVDFVPGI